jgi:hypothetical protein
MTQTKRIARGTDLTLITSGLGVIALAWAWFRYGSGTYRPAMTAIAILGFLCIVGGVAILVYAHRHRR